MYNYKLIKLKQDQLSEILMSKQKLAELVMQKIQQKKEEEERNRPHFQVLQLLVKFEIEQHEHLLTDITDLQREVNQQQQFLAQLDKNCMQLQNTGKKNYPRYIIKPNFIASENISTLTKQFYRKCSNTFLREDLLKKQRYGLDCQIFSEIRQKYQQIKQQQIRLEKQIDKKVKITNDKRVRNLKEDLRLRKLREEIEEIKQTIQQEKFDHRDLLAQYELKKTNLQQRVDWSKKLTQLIHQQKQLIQKVYNPISYREYLKTVFGIRIKNQSMHKSLLQVLKEVTKVEEATSRNQRFLEKTDNLMVIGKCADSPSRKKRKPPASLDMKKQATPRQRFRSSVGSLAHSPSFKESSRKSQLGKTCSTSLGKTTASSTFNIKDQNSSRKRCRSTFADLKNNKVKALQY